MWNGVMRCARKPRNLETASQNPFHGFVGFHVASFDIHCQLPQNTMEANMGPENCHISSSKPFPKIRI